MRKIPPGVRDDYWAMSVPSFDADLLVACLSGSAPDTSADFDYCWMLRLPDGAWWRIEAADEASLNKVLRERIPPYTWSVGAMLEVMNYARHPYEIYRNASGLYSVSMGNVGVWGTKDLVSAMFTVYAKVMLDAEESRG